jgi:hypothetical protein
VLNKAGAGRTKIKVMNKQEMILKVFKYQNDGIDGEVEFNGVTFMLSQISEVLGKISFEASIADVFGEQK